MLVLATCWTKCCSPNVQGWIDDMDRHLPALTNFILPSGGRAAAFLHLARSICRRAERSVVALTRANLVDEQVREERAVTEKE